MLTLVRFQNATAASTVLGSIDRTFHACHAFSATNPNTKRLTNVSLGPLSFPHIGEQGAAVWFSEPRFADLPCVLETEPKAGEIELAEKLRKRGLRQRRDR